MSATTVRGAKRVLTEAKRNRDYAKTAERMLTGAVDRGSSSKIASDYGRGPAVFVTYDGRMFNGYED